MTRFIKGEPSRRLVDIRQLIYWIGSFVDSLVEYGLIDFLSRLHSSFDSCN